MRPSGWRLRALAGPAVLVMVAACPLVLSDAFAGDAPGGAIAGTGAGATVASATSAAGSATRVATQLDRVLVEVAARADRLERARVAAQRAREGWAYGLPVVVRRVIAAGDRIATMPYLYGGGHGSFQDSGYDCSGSVSYALHGGGLLDVALDSGQFMSWGDAGPGRWITVYSTPSHAFMIVAGHRFDTTGREQTGSRWQPLPGDTSGYVVRHPPGL
ncbi:MAG TPA: hypothetical protein VHZ31_09120 [Solirubrobacteraceae bacterium]|jgi:hypothetical protein|nr:hypothetical protein [Solirubrobacteraceae bacterium]